MGTGLHHRHSRTDAELRLATELTPVDCGDLAERALRRVAEDRARAASRVGDRPERRLRELPLPAAGDLLMRTLAKLRRAPAHERTRNGYAGRRRGWPLSYVFAAAAAASVLAVLFLPDGFPPPQGPVALTSAEVVVRMVNGHVDVKSARGRERAFVGRHLSAGDVLETVGDAEALVSIGDHGSVVLDPFSGVRLADSGIDAARPTVPELEVVRGRAEGRLAEPSEEPAFRFSVAGKSYGLVRGRVGVVRVGADRYVLAAVSEAVVESDGVRVTVPEANVLRVSSGTQMRPEPWSNEVALSFRQKKPIAKGQRMAVVAGRTSPDVVLVINKTPVPVNRNGRFIATLRVPPHAKMLEAVVRDPLGRIHRKQLPVIRAKSRVDWLEPG